ncbi:MAG TPA: hypothetical protein ENJ56_05135, partial [Anaerolineae bacterium]|nr:hypothetical protein [Anaerolineae bacterium]
MEMAIMLSKLRILLGLLIMLLLFGARVGDVSAEPPPSDWDTTIHPYDTQQPEAPAADTRAPAATFTVVSTANIQDGNIGDGICGTGASGTGPCTLFAAIQEANNTGVHDTIYFNIPGSGPHTLVTQGSGGLGLPLITRPITIDGTSQSGANCPSQLAGADIRIMLKAGLGVDYGLRLNHSASGSIIKGLSIIDYEVAGIELDGADEVQIQCNHIGLEADGITEGPNRDGIRLVNFANRNIIGSTNATSYAGRNVISGNDQYGIFNNDGESETVISGNYIGLNAAGAAARPNAAGIYDRGNDTDIGGVFDYQRNVISGNDFEGITLQTEAVNIDIINNYIGSDFFGLFAVGNGTHGIRIRGNSGATAPTNIFIGGTTPANANIIRGNGGDGISVYALNGGDAPQEVTIRFNDIYNNGGLDIDLNNDGVTLNDAGDADSGPNGLQNYPLINGANNAGHITALFASSNGPSQTYWIDLFQTSNCVHQDLGNGGTYLDSFSITGGSGNFVTIDEMIDPKPTAGRYVIMTATDAAGNTSEFGNCFLVEQTTFVVDEQSGGIFSDDVNPGDGVCETGDTPTNCTLNAAIQEANALGGGPYNIYFDWLGSGANMRIALSDTNVLPTVTSQVVIDGIAGNANASCPDSSTDFANLRVTVAGNSMTGNQDGIVFGTGSNGSILRGIALVGFPNNAIRLNSGGHTVECNLIGLGSISSWDAPNGQGMNVASDDNVIGGATFASRNVIAENNGVGILLLNTAQDNTLSNNFVGTNQSGTSDRGNGSHGMYLFGGTSNLIEENVLSGNGGDGLRIDNGGNANTILNNMIGVSRDGSADLGNDGSGIYLAGVFNTTIGGDTAQERNVISGNQANGIHIVDADSTTITGNYIGTDVIGQTAISNGQNGIRNEMSLDLVIGDSSGLRNIISGNTYNGIFFTNGTNFATVERNLIGVASDGSALGNGFHGIHLNSATNSTLRDNTIANNTRTGVYLDSSVFGVDILGNEI